MKGSLNCPLCKGPSTPERSFDDVRISRCRNCDHCFTDLHNLSNMERYSDDYYERDHAKWFQHPNFALFEYITQTIRRRSGPNPSIVDLGCGRGDLLKYLKKKIPSVDIVGADFSKNEDSDGIRFFQGDVLSMTPAGQFDVVLNMAVIEHVTDVHSFVDQLKRHSKPGGLIITMTVNDRSLIYAAARAADRVGFRGPVKRLYSRHHLHHFNHRSLAALMTSHGLSIETLYNHNSPLKAVDLPESSPMMARIFLAATAVAFGLGQTTGRSLLQTLVCRNKSS